MAEAREQEHRMAVHAAIALHAEKDKELAMHQAAKVAATALAHREQVLHAVREHNARHMAELAKTRQKALHEQYAAEIEAGRVAALA